MKAGLTKIFFVKTTILVFFVTTAIVVAFILGRSFAGTLMGEISMEERIQQSTETENIEETQYSPLASPRFNYDSENYPRDQFHSYMAQRPHEDDVLSESARVEMTYSGGGGQSAESVFSLDNIGDSQDETLEMKTQDVVESNLIYKVLVKTPGERDNAENLYHRLKADGYDPLIVATVRGESDIIYHVQIAALRNLDKANELAEELRRKNYNAWVKYSRQ